MGDYDEFMDDEEPGRNRASRRDDEGALDVDIRRLALNKHYKNSRMNASLNFAENKFIQFWVQVAGDAHITDLSMLFADLESIEVIVRETQKYEKFSEASKILAFVEDVGKQYKDDARKRGDEYVRVLSPIAKPAWITTRHRVASGLGVNLVEFIENNKDLELKDAVCKLCASFLMRVMYKNSFTQMKGSVFIAQMLAYEQIFMRVVRRMRG